MTNPNEHVTVTQADRDAAERHYPPSLWKEEAIADLAQCLARHRIEATAKAEPDTQALLQEAREALGKIATMHKDWDPDAMFASSALWHASSTAAKVLTKLDAFLKGDPNVGRS